MTEPDSVTTRYQAIEARIAAACERAGRARDEVTLVGAAKRQPIERVREACAAGLRVIGENRVQEALAKQDELGDEVEWHLIGPLQSNKARKAAGAFDAVHSVDRYSIAEALNAMAGKLGKQLGAFIEVNVGREPTKHGFDPDGLLDAIRDLAYMEHLDILGLMAIPPHSPDLEGAREWFRALAALRDEMVRAEEWRSCPGMLSMGMSDDFEVAIEEGATHVRIGTALFGPRPS